MIFIASKILAQATVRLRVVRVGFSAYEGFVRQQNMSLAVVLQVVRVSRIICCVLIFIKVLY